MELPDSDSDSDGNHGRERRRDWSGAARYAWEGEVVRRRKRCTAAEKSGPGTVQRESSGESKGGSKVRSRNAAWCGSAAEDGSSTSSSRNSHSQLQNSAS